MAIFGRGFPVPFRQSQPLKGAAAATVDASITTTAALAGVLTTAITFAAAVSGTATVAAALTTPIAFQGAITATGTASGRVESGLLYPATDVSGTWSPSTPAAPLYSMIDESPYSDADYIYGDSADTPATIGLEVLSTTTALSFTIRWRET